MPRRLSPRKPKVQMRSVLVELPEDKVLALGVKAREAGWSVHYLAGRVLTEWLEGAK